MNVCEAKIKRKPEKGLNRPWTFYLHNSRAVPYKLRCQTTRELVILWVPDKPEEDVGIRENKNRNKNKTNKVNWPLPTGPAFSGPMKHNETMEQNNKNNC